MLIIKYRRLSREEKKIFWLSFRYLFSAFIKTSFFPMKSYVKNLGTHNKESDQDECIENNDILLKLKSGIRRTSKYAPFKSKCLQQAYAGKIILNQKQIPSTIYFGVAKDEKKGLKAHAWLRSGNKIICGEKGMNQFTVVSFFS